MKRSARLRALVCSLAVIFVTSGPLGCVVLRDHGPGPVVHAPGPPPHAPAHGHRRKHARGHREAELRFDSGLGVYVVIGHPGIYVHDGWYVRFDSGSWLVSASLEGPWKPRRSSWVPPGLREKHHAKHKKHKGRHKGGKHRGRGAAKGRW